MNPIVQPQGFTPRVGQNSVGADSPGSHTLNLRLAGRAQAAADDDDNRTMMLIKPDAMR